MRTVIFGLLNRLRLALLEISLLLQCHKWINVISGIVVEAQHYAANSGPVSTRQRGVEAGLEVNQKQPWQLCVPWPGESSGRARDDLSCQMPTFLWRKRAVNANGSSWSNHQQRAQHGATHDPHVDRTVQMSSYIHTCVHTHRSTVSVSVCLSVQPTFLCRIPLKRHWNFLSP